MCCCTDLSWANLASGFEFGEDILVSAAVLVYLVLAPVILPMLFVGKMVSLPLRWMFQVYVQFAEYLWRHLITQMCWFFQLHLQLVVSRVAHVYHGTYKHVFVCHRSVPMSIKRICPFCFSPVQPVSMLNDQDEGKSAYPK